MSYVSYACSQYYPILEDLGYPRLDVVEYEDGEWALREFLTLPVVPCLTKWNIILSGMRHIPVTRGFLKHQIAQIDPLKPWFHQRERDRSQAVFDEQEKVDAHREEFAEKAKNLIMRNEGLVERVATNGLKEINLPNIAKNINPWKLRGL